MLSAVVGFALRFRGIIYALALIVCGYGVYSATHARWDVFPEFAPPITIIQTEAPGFSAEQIETLVTQPIENALAGVLGVQSMRSKSLQGLSVVTVLFEQGAGVLQPRQSVAERLNNVAGVLPAGVSPPKLSPLTTSTSVVLIAGITSATLSKMELYDVAEWTLKPQLLAVPGVADAIIFGDGKRQMQVQVDPAKLLQFGLSMNDVVVATQAAIGVRGAGFIENRNQRITIGTDGQITSPAELAATVLTWRKGRGLRLGDVAQVIWAPESPVGAASIGGDPAVMLIVESQYGADTLTVSQDLEKILSALEPELVRQGVTLKPDIFKPADFIVKATDHLRNALFIGAVLVVVVLFLFLLNFRTAIISAVAIPLSLLLAVVVMKFFNITLNTMTLGGLAIALGEVVDDAIIDVENIYRRLRENNARSTPLPVFQVVQQASLEVRSSVVFATFAVILVFLPVLSLSGVAGNLFAPLGIAYILAVLASLSVALILTPAMSLGLLANKRLDDAEPRFQAWLKAHYRKLLVRVETRARTVIFLVALFCLAALAVVPFLRGNFIPELKEGHYILHVGLVPGSSLEQSVRVGNQISRALKEIDGVRLVAQHAGRAAGVVDPVGVQLSEIEVSLNPGSAAEQDVTLQQIRDTVASVPGVSISINTFLVERIDETISGATAPVTIGVFGNSLDLIDRKAGEIAQLVSTIPGATSVRMAAPAGVPQVQVRLKPEAVSEFGFQMVDVLDEIETANKGKIAAQIYQGNRSYDVNVILAPKDRATIDDIGELMLRNPEGMAVALSSLATISVEQGRYQIAHSGGRRTQTVLVDVSGRAISDFVSEVKTRVARDVILPDGTYTIFGGQDPALRQSQRDLLIYGTIALVGIVILLFLALGSRRAVVLVLTNLPFALVGGVVSVALTGGQLSLGGMVGFVTLFGISLRNSIMLISHYEHLVQVEAHPWGLATAILGASERLIPILMTAIVTALGLLPLALTSGEAGNEIEGPMAIVILGGLATSTLLNLIVLPTLAVRYGHFAPAHNQNDG
jgi:CzcA family heavy metal efflux pump